MPTLSESAARLIQVPAQIPLDWQWEALTDLCRPKQWPTIKVSELDGGIFPVYGANGLIGNHSTFTHSIEIVAITCRGATCGTINLIPPRSYVTGNAMALDDVETSRICTPFLAYSLHYRGLADTIEGSAQPQITRAGLSGVLLPLPPLPEQKKIAAILSSVDEAIQATQRVIDQTRRVKEGLLQDLLTRGLPGHHTRFKQTEIGEIPESWEVRRLEELLSDGPRNGVYKPASDIGEGTLIVGQTAFTTDRTVDCAAARRARATDDDLIRYVLRRGDILITRVYATQEGCGRPAMVTDLPEPAIYESNMMRIRVNEKQSTSGFLFHWLLHPVARRCLMSKSSSSNQTSINQETVGGLACPQPPLHEQDSIVSILVACDQQVFDARRELAVLTATKAGLLQDLLTGKVRVTP